MNDYALVIDDDRTERRIVSGTLKSHIGLTPVEASNGAEAIDTLRKTTNIKIIIMDLDMPIMDGREALSLIQIEHPNIPIIVLTGSAKTQDAVEAMKNGATDYLTKPLEPQRLIVSVRNGLKISLMGQEISRLKRKDEGAFRFADIIGYEHGLAKSVQIGQKAAASHLPVLISGQTGTGKELFARAIHGESNRAGQPFIAVNCGAIPENLVESTLFGHEKGAFTGATDKTLGKFQEAQGGTLFLDEVGELPLDTQVKLLRALQQKEIEPVGAGKPVNIDVRIISATNRDLSAEVQTKRFREDLYFRLNVLTINLPPLQVRGDDVTVLARSFIERYASLQNCETKQLSKDAIYALQTHSWPGNVRELENTISRAMALNDGSAIEADDLMLDHSSEPHNQNFPGTIKTLNADNSFKPFKELEIAIMQQALQHHNGNMSHTARVLGIAKSTLYTKLNLESNDQAKSLKRDSS